MSKLEYMQDLERQLSEAQQRIFELGAELAAVNLRHDILIQADVVGHPPVQDICDTYPECETEWLAAIIAWLGLDPTTDPDLLTRWAKREGGEV